MICENAANLVHCDSVTERLRAFMDTHDLSLNELAGLLRTPPETLEHWFQCDLTPPASLLALMVLFPIAPREKSLADVSPRAASLAGSSSAAHVLSNTQEEEALRRVRAI
jgi:hypothetical protein